MSSVYPGDPRVAASPFTIGNPGRAGLELPAGPPCARAGQSDIEMSAATLPGMLIRAATVRGLMHRSNGKPRQDAFAVGHDASERAIAVVCDGVGALGRSDEAATLVCRRLTDLAAVGTPWPDAFPVVNAELCAQAGRYASGDDRDGMATTAVALVVHQVGEDWVGEVAWVGDSSLWHLGADGRWTALTGHADEGGEKVFHSTGVRPMPTADGGCTHREFRARGGALFTMTDGIANPLKWSDEVRETLAKWWERPPDPFIFAAQVAFARKTHVDDRTVVAIWPET